ncbi:MAG TPA: hypothetical protein VHR15_06615 [Ktedonobacterales bacterium]|jgi:hypothetical protein|nr:hypothetical protein [Ktedonobacterales bacterium]
MDNFPIYQTALFLHILGAISFFIAIAILYTSVLGVRRAQTVQQIKLWTGAVAPVIRLVFPIAALVILIAGFYMAAVSWRAAWVGIALIAFLLLTIVSALLQGRRITLLGRQVADQPDNTPVTGALWTQAHDPVTWIGVNTAAAFATGIVYLMTLKPDALGSVIALLIALVVGLAFGFLTQGRAAAAPALAHE